MTKVAAKAMAMSLGAIAIAESTVVMLTVVAAEGRVAT